ncbi:MAG TPA: cysteine-rich CWC family protein [Ohtaekwangia sp.]|uniref:cysteine-rich CWC family protein n=1 Tax=Ohtaekwangia sp. TaxID=2066019 RepID=UPI002F9473EE
MKHEQKKCPRCQTAFECKVGSITLCQCSTVTLREDERNYMRENFTDCLCAACMVAMQKEYQGKSFLKKLKSMITMFR